MSETKADYGKACKCGVCGLSKIIQQIAERCTEEEKQALETLWNRMETAETNIVMDKPKEHAKAVMHAVRVLQNTTYAPTKSENTFWAGVDHSITEMVNYSEAIRRGEVEI